MTHLIDRGADPNAQDLHGTTPLHMAASRGHVKCAVALLTGGADWSLPSESGRIPFEIAVVSAILTTTNFNL